MAKQNNIRWRRSDYSKLSHLTRKVNKKILEIEVKKPDLQPYQPQYLDYQELKSQIKTRRDLKNVLNKYNRYLREGAEEIIKSDRGAVASKWAVKEFEINQRAENARRRAIAKKLNEQNVTIAGKDTGIKRAEMGSIKEHEVKPSTKKFKNQSQREWELASKLFDRKMHSTYNDEQTQKMIENYVKGLIAEGYPDELLEMFNKVPVEKFKEIVDTDETATFDFIYDPLEMRVKADSLIELWEQHIDENVNNGIDFNAISEIVKMEYETGMRSKGYGRIKTKRRRK